MHGGKNMGQKTIIGIDLGMSTTIISSFIVGLRKSPEIVPILDQKIIPTAIRLGNEPGVVAEFGTKALKEASKFPEYTLFNFKSAIGTGNSLSTPFGDILADDICILYLRSIRENLVKVQYGSSSFGNGWFETKIGYPVHWPKDRRKALCRIAEKAGFPKVDAYPEPLGVAAYHLFRSGGVAPQVGTKTLIIDFGALTTDISIIEHDSNGVSLPKPLGGIDLGGRDVDQIISEKLTDDLLQATEREMLDSIEKKNLLLISESIKKSLKDSKNHATTSYADDKTHSYIELRLDKDELETKTEAYRKDVKDFISNTLKRTGYKQKEIFQVLLAGGMSNMYFTNKLVRDALTDISVDSILKDPDPQLAIAKGLAYSGEGLPKILEMLRGKILSNVEDSVERLKPMMVSKTLEAKLSSACRLALDIVWSDVSKTELLHYKLSPFKKIEECPSVIKIRDAVTNAVQGVLDKEIRVIIKHFADDLQVGISSVFNQFQQELLNISKINSNSNSSEAVGDALDSSTDGISGSVTAVVAATVTAVISSQMIMVPSWIILTTLNPAALASLIVASIIGLLVSAKTINQMVSIKEKMINKIIHDLGTRSPNPKNKKDHGGLLYRLWHDESGLRQNLLRIGDTLWSGTKYDGTIIRDSNGDRVPRLQTEAEKMFTDVAISAS
jgi:hypothetical protein